MLEPHFFGSLTDEPVVDTGTHDLFPGDDRFLSCSARRKRGELCESLAGPLERVLEEGEHVLWVAPAQQSPTLFESIGLGWWFYHLHRTALVLTDRRLVEILLDSRGKRAETRIRSWAWCGLKKMKYRFGTLKVIPEGGRAASWRIRMRGDRKVLKSLLSKIEGKVPKISGVTDAHRWLCPECGASNEPAPDACSGCRTGFRTQRLATVLSLAFPGGGLFYVGRPVFATLDLIGETLLFLVVALALTVSSSVAEGVSAASFGVFLLFLTKLESVHLSRVLVRRTIPENEGRRSLWTKLGAAGGALSGVAIVGALAVTGLLATPLVNDLTFADSAGAWVETRAEEEFLADEGDQRSQWVHPNGTTVYVSAYPLGVGESWSDFRDEYLSLMKIDGAEPTMIDEDLPEGFRGFRCYVPIEAFDGEEFVSVNYMFYDSDSTAVHHVYTFVEPEWLEAAAYELDDLVNTASWIPAVDPTL